MPPPLSILNLTNDYCNYLYHSQMFKLTGFNGFKAVLLHSHHFHPILGYLRKS